MSTVATPRLAIYLADLEELWQKLDVLIGSLGPGDWSRRHGKDWTLADVPYHLAYFDDMIAKAIERGPNVPATEQRVMRTMRELNAWNAAKFAERAPGQTPQQSVAQMRASREAVRRAIGRTREADLERPVFIPLDGCGWLPARFALEACRAHTWEEYEEFRLVLERTSPRPSDRITHATLGLFVGFFPALTLNREAAKQTRFTLVQEITGPGGGAWTIRVGDGGFTLSEERAANADVVMTQSVETFLRTWVGWLDPAEAMQTGAIKLQGMEKMDTFAQLFPPPGLDTVIEPMGAPAPWA